MSTNIGFRMALTGAVLGAGALATYACTTTEVNPTDGGTTTGQSTGMTNGTTNGTSTTGNTNGTSNGSTNGASNGSTNGTTGTDSAVSGANCVVVPTSGLMADFSASTADDAGGVTFGTPGSGVYGGTYFYPALGQGTATYYDAGGKDACTGYCGCDTNLAASAFTAGGKTGGPWVFSGEVATYSGGGTWLSPCVNASAFTGIEITVSGSTGDPDPDGGSTNTLQLSVWQLSNWNVGGMVGGTCLADGATCTPASATFAIPGTDTPTPVTVHFSDLKGGVPEATLNDPSTIIQLQIQVPWTNSNCLTGATYKPNVSISKIAFVQ
jgi:hypothetical protein